MGKKILIPYYQVLLLVVEVVDLMLSSSTIRDFHQNSFWQHHCDGTRKLYTNSGVHTVRSKEFEIVIAQTNSSRSHSSLNPKAPLWASPKSYPRRAVERRHATYPHTVHRGVRRRKRI